MPSSSKSLKKTATTKRSNDATQAAAVKPLQTTTLQQHDSLELDENCAEQTISVSAPASPTNSMRCGGFLSAKTSLLHSTTTKTSNRVSKEALRRLARSWHLKSSAVALDRLTDPAIAVATHDPEFCLALWKAAAYLAVESGSKTITAKFVDHAILVNNILAEGCETRPSEVLIASDK